MMNDDGACYVYVYYLSSTHTTTTNNTTTYVSHISYVYAVYSSIHLYICTPIHITANVSYILTDTRIRCTE